MKYREVKLDDANHLNLSSQVMVEEEVPIFHKIHQSEWWIGMCFFRVAELLKRPMVVSPELFPRVEHLMLNKSGRCLIYEIKHETLLQRKNRYELGFLHM